jgi:hypothetical protein
VTTKAALSVAVVAAAPAQLLVKACLQARSMVRPMARL